MEKLKKKFFKLKKMKKKWKKWKKNFKNSKKTKKIKKKIEKTGYKNSNIKESVICRRAKNNKIRKFRKNVLFLRLPVFLGYIGKTRHLFDNFWSFR